MHDASVQKSPLRDDLSFGLLLKPKAQSLPVTQYSVGALREHLSRHRLLVLRGFHSGFDTPSAFACYARTWGDIMTWPFGEVFDVEVQENPIDSVFDSSYLPLHWDGMYRETIPELQLFHCVRAPDLHGGGETIFVDTVSLLQDADRGLRDALSKASIICRVKKASHYGGEVHSPLIVPHPVTGEQTLRYYEPVDDPLLVNPHTSLTNHLSDRHQQELRNMLSLPRYRYAHAWQSQDLVIADNFALLHGRNAFDRQSQRHLSRIHIHASPIHLNSALCLDANAMD